MSEKAAVGFAPLRTVRTVGMRAFTLIELLVVVAIIGLLVSILMPYLSMVKVIAKDMVCATNLRAVGVAWQFYFEDNQECFPRQRQNMQWFYGGNEPSIYSLRDPTWYPSIDYRPLNPYMQMSLHKASTAAMFRCPLDGAVVNANTGASSTEGHPTYEFYGNSYMMVSTLLQGTDPNTTGRIKDVQVPISRMVLAGDSQWYYASINSPYDASFHNRQDRVNLLFLDTHVSFTKVLRGKDHGADYTLVPRDSP